MAMTGVKFDDGSGGFTTNCFPVRGLVKFGEDESGAWVVAQKAEQRRRFKAVLCTKPRDFESIRQERKRAEREGTAIVPPVSYEDEQEEVKVLDGFFLMKHCCVEDPVDLCSVNISGQGFCDVKEEDFQLFDNVAYVNAAENFLPLDCFKSFPILRELEMPLNGLRGIKMKLGEFMNLELLDLSYNNLSPEDVLPLGLLPNLRILHLTGNGLTTLLPDMAHPHVEPLKNGIRRIQRFASLEILLLDDNRLSDLTAFAALAGLRKLKHLNLSKNEIYSVPQLMLVEGRHVTQDFDEGFRSQGKTPKSGRKSSRSRKSSRKSDRKSAKSNKGGGGEFTAENSNISVNQQLPQQPQQLPHQPADVMPVDTSQAGISTGEFLKEVQHLVRADGESRKTTEPSLLQENSQLMTDRNPSKETTDMSGKQTSEIDSISQSQKNSMAPNTLESHAESKQEPIPEQEDAGKEEEAAPRMSMVTEQGVMHNGSDTRKSLDSLLDLDDMLEELNLDKIDEKVDQQITHEKEQAAVDREKEEMLQGAGSNFQIYSDDPDLPLPPPFPELRYLNMAHNQIEEEEGLLAVAAWPMLSELVIHDNPLTKERSGDPPLLKRFLHDRLGIHVERKKPAPVSKPHIEVTPKAHRTVKTYIPPVPRCDVDALLALEYKPSPVDASPTPQSGRSSATPTQGGFETSLPLPPIQQTPLDSGMIIEEEEEDEEGSERSQRSERSHKQDNGEAFFMTAVDDQREEPVEPVAASSEKGEKKKKKKKQPKKKVDERFKGFEELLDIDEDEVKGDLPTPKDVVGNIRALQYTLNHPLVFRENKVFLDRPQKPYQPFVRGVPKESKPRKPRTYIVEEALTFLKERRTTEEEPLQSVLKNPKAHRKHFSDAPDLLQQVQHKYNRVRARSVKEARDVQKLIKETISDVDEQARNSGLVAYT